MLFNSYIFILFFLPLCVSGYYIVDHFWRQEVALIELLVMSFFFYGYGNWSYLGILTLSIMTNWTISQLIQNKWKGNKAFLVIGILFNIGLIFVFKYYDFFLENLNVILREDISILKLALPLGISFYTFQQISYLIDTYRGETKEYSFIEYAVFVSFFPQLVAGPIVLHKEIIPQLKKRKIKA